MFVKVLSHSEPSTVGKVETMREGINAEIIGRKDATYLQVALASIRTELDGGNPVCMRVAGDSMVPLLQSGDAVWIAPIGPAGLRRGDLVVFCRADSLVAHRLVAVDPTGWRTKGDNRSHLDPPVADTALLGRVIAIQREGTQIELRGLRWTVVSRLLGLTGWWEVRLFQMGRRLFRTEQRPVNRGLSCLAAVPFRWLSRLMLR